MLYTIPLCSIPPWFHTTTMMEIRVVVSDEFADEFGAGGGFMPSHKFRPPEQDAARHQQQQAGPVFSYAAQYPTSCSSLPSPPPAEGGKPRKRTCFLASFQAEGSHSHEVDPAAPKSTTASGALDGQPRRLTLVIGRDQLTSNAVVKHALPQGVLLSRQHCAIRCWFPHACSHPMFGDQFASTYPLAFDCVDFGTVNGTFVNGKKIPSSGLPCAPVAIDSKRLWTHQGTSPTGATAGSTTTATRESHSEAYGAHVMTLSFGVGARLAEGDQLPAESTRLRFDVYARVVAQPPAIVSIDSFVTHVLRSTLPQRSIAMPQSMVKSHWSSTFATGGTASGGGEEGADAVKKSSMVCGLVSSQPAGSAPAEDDQVKRKSAKSLAALDTQFTCLPPDSRASFSSVAGWCSKRLLAASRTDLSPIQPPVDAVARHNTEDVLAGILHDHGYRLEPNPSLAPHDPSALPSSLRQEPRSPHQLAQLLPCEKAQGGSDHPRVVANPVVMCLDSSSVETRDDSAVRSSATRHSNEVSSAHAGISKNNGAVQREDDDAPVDALLLRRAKPPPAAPDNAACVVAPCAAHGDATVACGAPVVMLSQIVLSAPEFVDVVPSANYIVERSDSDSDAAGVLLRRGKPKTAAPRDVPVDAKAHLLPPGTPQKKKRGQRGPLRLTTDAVARFCEELRGEGKPPMTEGVVRRGAGVIDEANNESAVVARSMAEHLKASIRMGKEILSCRQVTAGRYCHQHAAPASQDDDVPLGALLLTAATGHQQGFMPENEQPAELARLAPRASTLTMVFPPPDREARDVQCQLEEFVASQIGDSTAKVEGSSTSNKSGGIVFVAGSIAAANSSVAAEVVSAGGGALSCASAVVLGWSPSCVDSGARHETLRCLFDDGSADEVCGMESHEFSAQVGDRTTSAAAATGITTSVAAHQPHYAEAPQQGPQSPTSSDLVTVTVTTSADKGVVASPHRIADESCASWAPTQGTRTVLVPTQSPDAQGSAASFSQTVWNHQQLVASQAELTTYAVRPVFLQLASAQKKLSPRQAVSDHDDEAALAVADSTPYSNNAPPNGTGSHTLRNSERRVTFDDTADGHARGPMMSQRVTLDTDARSPQASDAESKLKQPTNTAPRAKRAQNKRARLDVVFAALPSAVPPSDEDFDRSGKNGGALGHAAATLQRRHFSDSVFAVMESEEGCVSSDPSSKRAVTGAVSERVLWSPQHHGGAGFVVTASPAIRAVLMPHQWEALCNVWGALMPEASVDSRTAMSVANASPSLAAAAAQAVATIKTKNVETTLRVNDSGMSASKKRRLEGSSAAVAVQHRDDTGDDIVERAGTAYDFLTTDDDGNGETAKRSVRSNAVAVHATTAPGATRFHAAPRGYILAHAMGLGKTLTTLAVAFTMWRHLELHEGDPVQSPWLHSLRASGGVKLVVCVPKPLVYHWIRELHKWTTEFDEPPVVVYVLSHDAKSDRLSMIEEWAADARRCVLLTTHTTFCALMSSTTDAPSLEDPVTAHQSSSATSKLSSRPKGTSTLTHSGKRNKHNNAGPAFDQTTEDEPFWFDEEDAADNELEECDPPPPPPPASVGGAAVDASLERRTERLRYLACCRKKLQETTNFLVVDEAHRLQHPSSRFSKCLAGFRGPHVMKLALTGTPVTTRRRDELLAILQLIHPQLWMMRDLGDRGLAAMLRSVMHAADLQTLAADLPPLVEHNVVVRFSPLQRQLYTKMILSRVESRHARVVAARSLLDVVSKTMLISNHCDLVADWWQSQRIAAAQRMKRSGDVVDCDELGVPRHASWATPALSVPSALGVDLASRQPKQPNIAAAGDTDTAVVAWNASSGADEAMRSLDFSWKMRVLIGLLDGALTSCEKVVVFSHSVKTLFIIGKLLLSCGLEDGHDFALLDGRTPTRLRDEVTAAFNDESNARLRVLLLSFHSGSLGQSFIGAQRVILMEGASWNQTLARQAVCRVFRYGQRRAVFVNRLMSANGVEEILWERGCSHDAPSSASCSWPVERLLRGVDEPAARSSSRRDGGDPWTVDGDPVLAQVLQGATCVSSVHRIRSF